jgi:hypothetical protein
LRFDGLDVRLYFLWKYLADQLVRGVDLFAVPDQDYSLEIALFHAARDCLEQVPSDAKVLDKFTTRG